MQKLRHYIFLRDVLVLAFNAFGGPHAHLALFQKILVEKRRYISPEELIHLNSFCRVLPGPASTQTIIAIGYRLGGPQLAFLTLIFWILPAVSIMITAAVLISHVQNQKISLEFTRYLQPIAVGFVFFSVYKITRVAVRTWISIMIFLISFIACFSVKTPAVFPIVIFIGGVITSFLHSGDNANIPPGLKAKGHTHVKWSGLLVYVLIFTGAALLGHVTRGFPEIRSFNLLVRLFENFFRNGSLTFGGGQALIGMLHKQFVEFRTYLTDVEFLSGYALLQALPGPLFSFSAYIGALAMRSYGVLGQICGGVVGAAGIFLPGTLMIFFVIGIWDKVKGHPSIKASMEGVNAASGGTVLAAAFLLLEPVSHTFLNYGIMAGTFFMLGFTKVPPPLIIAAGILTGLLV
jgi:chromate transporter